MASLRDLLPAPRHASDGSEVHAEADTPVEASSPSQAVEPSTASSAFPAVTGANLSADAAISAVLPLQRTTNGAPDFTALAVRGENASRVVHRAPEDVEEKARNTFDLSRPTEEEVHEATSRTREALKHIVEGKVTASRAKNFRGAADGRRPEYIRYTPANSARGHNSGAGQRVIKMMQAPVDPMEPPRFSRKKTAVDPPSPPVPVLHSPTRKASREQVQDWIIPPAISNWKNNRGYTVPLDKRLAADPSGQKNVRINDKFAELAESLYVAERTAREQVEKRAQIARSVSLKAKEAKQNELRELAARARRERAGLTVENDPEPEDGASETPRGATRANDAALPPSPPPPPLGNPPGAQTSAPHVAGRTKRRSSRFADLAPDRSGTPSHRPRSTEDGLVEQNVGEEDKDVRRRDQIRAERRKEREREMRARQMRGEDMIQTGGAARTKGTRDHDRDVAERVALGQDAGGGGKQGELLYDQRLFNQGGAGSRSRGIRAGYGADDTDTLYDKPLFGGGDGTAGLLYRPTSKAAGAAEEEGSDGESRAKGDTRRFKPDRGFANGNADGAGFGRRTGPVEFERDEEGDLGKGPSDPDGDPFGLDTFLPQISKDVPKAPKSERMDEGLRKRRASAMSGFGGGEISRNRSPGKTQPLSSRFKKAKPED